MKILRRQDARERFKIRRKQMTAEGFLDIWGVCARVGPLEYVDAQYPDGVRIEMATPEALKSSVETLQGAVVTLLHPPEGEVTPDTAREHSRGHVREAVYDEEEQANLVHLRVTDREAIESILKQETIELSPGYDVTEWDEAGEDEDHHINQRARYINHLAIVDKGRGQGITLRTDSKERQMEDEEHEDMMEGEEEKKEDASEGMDYQDAYMKEKKKADMLQARVDMLEAKMKNDMEGGEHEDMDEEHEDMKGEEMKDSRTDSRTFLQAFEERKRALRVAESMGLKDMQNASNLEIMGSCVAKYQGRKRLDSYSAEMIRTSFDMLEAQRRGEGHANSDDVFAAVFANRETMRQDAAEDQGDGRPGLRASASLDRYAPKL